MLEQIKKEEKILKGISLKELLDESSEWGRIWDLSGLRPIVLSRRRIFSRPNKTAKKPNGRYSKVGYSWRF